MNNAIRPWNPDDGDLCQGDVLLFRLPEGFAPDKAKPLAPLNGRLILAQGELTRHSHAIWFEQPPFHDSQEARGDDPTLQPTSIRKQSQAALYRDELLARQLVEVGHLTTAELTIGFLVIEGAPAVLRHEEHDAVRIPPGTYYVGGQREFHANRPRRIID
jgi:hypothetical protein